MTEWKISNAPVPYQDALEFMDRRVTAIHAGAAADCVWLLEHPPLYTAGTSAKAADMLDPRFPVYQAGRGGEYTYHGPGQRIAYVMRDLRKTGGGPDVRRHVCNLENWVIRALKPFGIDGVRREGRIGVWVDTPGGEKKIAAIGVRVRRWVTLHGIAVNINPDLSHFGGIVPCGLAEYGVTSMAELLGQNLPVSALDEILKEKWPESFLTLPTEICA